MDIICHNCHSKFKIADDKIPAGRTAAFACPKCKSKISLGPGKSSAKGAGGAANDESYDASDKPFDFIEEEGLTALVCEQNPLVRKTISDALQLMEYQITVAESARDALKRMRYHVYDLIVVNESFDTNNPEANGVIIYLERLSMATRRNMFVALVSDRYRTMDNMMALNKSVNLIINVKNIEDIGKILSRGITDNEYFYRVFKETLKELGRV
ncbi:MAG: zinc-ribbon domain-containing protein [Desulfobacterales bacterium]|nr:MAG: zinc-ribbon domain-containing protein [Desulfobacterales bacterium]